MVGVIAAIEEVLDRISRVLLSASNVLLVLLFLLINAEIVLRATLGRSTLVSDEYSGYFLCWLTLAGFLFAMRTNAFLRVGFVVERASGARRRALDVFAAVGGLFISIVATYASAAIAHTNWRFNAVSTQYAETPLYIPQSFIAFSFGLLAFAYAVQVLASLSGREDRTRGAV